MTEISWGPGLNGEQMKALALPENALVRFKSTVSRASDWVFDDGPYHLPADHFASIVQQWNNDHPNAVPFVPWTAGDAAPPNWDGGDVLLRLMALGFGQVWTDQGLGNDIIGYRPRTEAPTASLPTYDPATHMVVERMTEAQATAFFKKYESDDRTWREEIVFALDVLGIIVKAEPTPAERMASDIGITVEQAELALAWVAAGSAEA